ncbi:MAG: FkbM family methyltransferase [Phycisphaerales bacterium]|jgi:FkbM family methyltransferase
MTPETLATISFILCLVLLVGFILQYKQVSRIRSRVRRSMQIGPEAHLRLQRQLYDRIAQQDCKARGFTPVLPAEFRSEWGEDTLLYDLFAGQETGIYIEAGALDGKDNSVTWIFEAIGWTGLLVEPTPSRLEDCKRFRPGSTVVHAALDSKETDGTTTFMVPKDPDHQFSAHRAEHSSKEVREGLDNAGAQLDPVQVPLTTLTAALDKAGFDHVDFAVIDVEGFEADVLKGFDLARFKPRVLVVEDLSFSKTDPLEPILKPAGYKQVMWIGANRVYLRSDDERMIERAARLAETVYSPLVRPKGHPDRAPHNVS